jgi:spectrin beta
MKPGRGKFRIHMVQNMNYVLDFLKAKQVKMVNIGAEDLCEGAATLTLGTIWSIIYYLQIGEIEGADQAGAKAALLRWCQVKTKGYAGVDVQNFNRSWQNGMAFNALIHKHRPDLIDYASLPASDAVGNLDNAFQVAERALGIDSLLDPEDVVTCPDDKSIMTYLMAYYVYFNQMKDADIFGQRVRNFVDFQMEIDHLINRYEEMASDLLDWIQRTTQRLNKRDFPNNLDGVQQCLDGFKVYQTTEKPPRIQERGELEGQVREIQTKLMAKSRDLYNPPPELDLRVIKKGWDLLEDAEKNRAGA